MSQYDESSIEKIEQEEIKKAEQQRLEKDRIAEEKRLAEERRKAYEKNQEKIRKDSEARRQANKDSQENARINRENLMKGDRAYIGGEDVIPYHERIKELEGRELEQELEKSQKSFDQKRMAIAYAKSGNEKVIEKHDKFKSNYEELQKINLRIEQTKDRATLKKLHERRKELEKEIQRENRVFREKPKLFDSKEKRERLDQKYQGKLQDKMQELTKAKDHAEKAIAQLKNNDNEQNYQEYEKSIREQVQQRVKERADLTNTKAHGRGR